MTGSRRSPWPPRLSPPGRGRPQRALRSRRPTRSTASSASSFPRRSEWRGKNPQSLPVDPLRVARGTHVNSLKLQDVDSGAPCSEGLHRLKKIWGGHFREFGLRSSRDLHAEEEDCHRVSPSRNSDAHSELCLRVRSIGNRTKRNHRANLDITREKP